MLIFTFVTSVTLGYINPRILYDAYCMREVYLSDIVRSARGIPLEVNLRFVTVRRNMNLSQTYILRSLVAQLKSILTRIFTPIFYPNGRPNRRNILPRITGYIGVTVLDTGNVHGFQYITAEEITYDRLMQYMQETILQSNQNSTIDMMEWKFVIDQSSVTVGGAGRVRPGFVNKPFDEYCYVEHSDEQGPISCAAFALNYVLKYPEYAYKGRSSKKVTLEQIKKDARELQTKLQWYQYVSISDIKQFVNLYPEYRVTVIMAGNAVHFRNDTFEGTQFDSSILNESSRTITSKDSKVFYLVYDVCEKHYYPINSPLMFLCNVKKARNFKFCHTCVKLYDAKTENHNCLDTFLDQQPEKKRQIRTCDFCQQKHFGRCTCRMSTCSWCNAIENEGHRCIVTKKTDERPTDKQEFYDGRQELYGKAYALWAYDLEARVELTQDVCERISEFPVDEDGYFTQEDGIVYSVNVRKHTANLVVAKNVYTGEEKMFEGDECLEQFVQFMNNYNNGVYSTDLGRNICVAHNGAGYDTRLIFEQAVKLDYIKEDKINPLMRGGKFMKLDIGKLTFQDSLLHLPGSLRALAKDFCSEVRIEKGYFPHLFNSVENYDYVGPIPDIETFDLSFVIKDEKELEDFYDWYNSWKGRTDWSFKDELRKYCINDVAVLAHIMKSYNDILVEKFSMSPWFNTTAPSYVHEVYLRKLFLTLELPDPKEDPVGYTSRVQRLAWEEYWAVLEDPEYKFARQALRGGRTEIRKIYHTVSDEDWDRGVRIRYQDICSQYPYQQAVHEFPVGLPTIYVWDPLYRPCTLHRDFNCICTTDRNMNKKVSWVPNPPKPSVEEILADESFFGIVCCTMEPPKNLYHPVLVHRDEKRGKTIASLERIEKGTFTSIEFKKALEMGYQLIELHRFDKYNKKFSLWADVIKDLFIEKMVNSSNLPSVENQERLKKDYDEQFDMGDELQKTFDEKRWGKNPAKKKTFKIMLNSGWGKHCQRPIMTEAAVLDPDSEKTKLLFENFSKQNLEFQSVDYLGTWAIYRYKKNDRLPGDYHDGYLPAGLFVPAYGRLHLWEQLNKLGKRVLMNDTDSIVYIYDPEQYNIPEGDVWGQWEVEDIDKQNGGIRTFVGLGPKTYAIKCENGETLVKAKGLSLKRAHKNLVNFQEMERMVLEFLNENKTSIIRVPQMTFFYKIGKGMQTRLIEKDFKFNENDVKGELDSLGHLYPFGHE